MHRRADMYLRHHVRSTTSITVRLLMSFVPRRRAPHIASLVIVAVAVACGSDSSPSGTGGTAVASVAVSPTTLNLHPGDNGTLTATARSATGAVLTGKTFV